jgi:hypothetical protein
MKMKPFVEGRSVGTDWRGFYNGKYQVQMRPSQDNAGRAMVILAIRREDRKPIFDWRDVQWIKNQLLGPEIEAVQLFPAESRLVDTANQYYVFAYVDAGVLPFGFPTRMVVEKVNLRLHGHGKSEQRPFAEHVKPADLEVMEEQARVELREFGAEPVD